MRILEVMLVRLAAISDMHGNAVAFEAVIADMKQQNPDAIVCLGDIVMRGPQPKECVELVQSLNPIATLRGNADHFFTRFPQPDWQPQSEKQENLLRAFEYDVEWLSEEEQMWLGHLPLEHALCLDGLNIELYHAAPGTLYDVYYPWATLEELENLHQHEYTQLVLFGHVHHAYVRQANGRTIVNTGSAGFSFDGDNRASYAIIDIERGNIAVQLRRITYDIEKVIQIAKERSMPNIEALEYGLKVARYPYNRIAVKN